MILEHLNPRQEDLDKPEYWQITPKDIRDRYEKFREYPWIYMAYTSAKMYELKEIRLLCAQNWRNGKVSLKPITQFAIEDFIKQTPKEGWIERDWREELQQHIDMSHEILIGLFQLAVLQEDYKWAQIFKAHIELIPHIETKGWESIDYDF